MLDTQCLTFTAIHKNFGNKKERQAMPDARLRRPLSRPRLQSRGFRGFQGRKERPNPPLVATGKPTGRPELFA